VNSTRDNGRRVHWNHAVIGWSGGDEYQLEVPHYIDGWPIAWLERNLEGRVRAVPGCEQSLVAVTEATPSSRPHTAGYDAPGSIVMARLRQPFPDASRLRREVSAAVDEAYSVAEAADQEAEPFLDDLRRET
jgi:hypothetical protein